jgi:hypothetical protein
MAREPHISSVEEGASTMGQVIESYVLCEPEMKKISAAQALAGFFGIDPEDADTDIILAERAQFLTDTYRLIDEYLQRGTI